MESIIINEKQLLNILMDDNGLIDMSNEGTIDPITLLGALRLLEHSALREIDIKNAEQALKENSDE